MSETQKEYLNDFMKPMILAAILWGMVYIFIYFEDIIKLYCVICQYLKGG